MEKPLVSIIIPTYNSEKTIGRCLNSITKQTYENIEVLIIDNYSKDRTLDIAKKFKARIYLLKSGRAKAKNFGTKKARGKYVLYLDSDMELEPEVVEECVYLAEKDSKIAGIIIPEETIGSSFWAKVRNYERKFYAGTLVESPRFFRRNLVLNVGGFDEDIIFYEEATLPIKIEKLGYNVRARISSKIKHIEEHFNLRQWIIKKLFYAKTLRKYRERYREYYVKQASPTIRLLLFLLNKKFYKNPLLCLAVLYLKTLEYLASLIAMIT